MGSASTGEHGTCVSEVCPLLLHHRLDLLHGGLGCEGFSLLVEQVSTTKARAGIVINVPCFECLPFVIFGCDFFSNGNHF